jgi:putative phage-type endonuclease
MDTGLIQGSEEWKQARYHGVTGTDVATILGLNPNLSKKKLFYHKLRREDPPVTGMGRTLMDLGKQFEPVAKAAFLRWAGSNMGAGKSVNLLRHKNFEWLVGSPDYLLGDYVIEFKTHFFPSITVVRPYEAVGKIPLRYYLQVQAYLEITDKQKGILVSWTANNGFTVWDVQRDKVLMNTVLPELEKFAGDMWLVQSMGGPDTGEGLKKVEGMRMEKGMKEYWTHLVFTSLTTHITQRMSPIV